MSYNTHIHDGGIGITNFTPEQRQWYQIALDRLYVEFPWSPLAIGAPMYHQNGKSVTPENFALVSLTGKFPPEISRYWEIHKEVKKYLGYKFDFERMMQS